MRSTSRLTGSPRWAGATGGLMAMVLLAACSSSISNAATPVAASGRPSSTATGAATGPITMQGLGAKMSAGSAGVTSAHIIMLSKVGKVTTMMAQGDETLADGRLTSMRLHERVGDVDLTILLVDDAVYLMQAADGNTSGKPWVKATAGSTDPGLKAIAATITSVRQNASLSQYQSFVQAASSLKTVGVEQVNGAPASHYSLVVDVAKVRSEVVTAEMRKGFAQLGITTIPLHVWVDDQGRLAKLTEKFALKGQVVTTYIGFSQINEPVTVTAPPPSQVWTS